MAYNFDHGSWLNSARHLNGADKQMYFQSTMSSTAHQREIEDLKAAGLNPVLSAGGSGASTPTGAYDETADQPAAAVGGVVRVAKKSIDNSGKAVSQMSKTLGKVAEAVAKSVKDVVNRPNTAKVNYDGIPQIQRRGETIPTVLNGDNSFLVANPIKARNLDVLARPDTRGISIGTLSGRYNRKKLSFDDLKALYSQENDRDWYNTAYTSTNVLQGSLPRIVINTAKDLPMHMSAGYRQQIRWVRKNAKDLKEHMTPQAWKDYANWLRQFHG